MTVAGSASQSLCQACAHADKDDFDDGGNYAARRRKALVFFASVTEQHNGDKHENGRQAERPGEARVLSCK